LSGKSGEKILGISAQQLVKTMEIVIEDREFCSKKKESRT
jgi:hypothetical protein